LVLAIHGETTEDHHWNRVRHVPPDAARRRDLLHGARRKRIIADNASSGADNERP